MPILRTVEMKFTFQITSEDVQRKNADLFRLYELFKATADMHAHNGWHITSSGCENKGS